MSLAPASYAGATATGGTQFCGSSASIRAAGCSATRSRTSARYASHPPAPAPSTAPGDAMSATHRHALLLTLLLAHGCGGVASGTPQGSYPGARHCRRAGQADAACSSMAHPIRRGGHGAVAPLSACRRTEREEWHVREHQPLRRPGAAARQPAPKRRGRPSVLAWKGKLLMAGRCT